MEKVLEKVTCFITRKKDNKSELLLIQHPNAGIQIPAGTVEINEDFHQAAIREAIEETGLQEFVSCKRIGKQEQNLEGKYIIFDKAKIYSRPDISSFQWAEIRRGITVLHERNQGQFVQITYKEGDKFPEPNYVTYQITGWTEKLNLASKVTRQFYHLQSNSYLDEWEIETDNQNFKLCWYPIDNLPHVVSPQNEWLQYLLREMNNLD
ncbi:NUDIX domain-containing protein [Halalkalibacter sp. APA_J-10(15)]|uniref:NUDIX domain-containing protein n=1 Tax=Halalkalibacter sp. APA_J-10(15) TaxID=2933805 RepID=UPI001FF61F05|nr:NUDIX domain-containing protein [Halalkalibacter sp. APA_J-10(15)]MCK0470419.1 NUDIX domain-containing protein [Halalkalibacter sp. APA_J-10(15)]